MDSTWSRQRFTPGGAAAHCLLPLRKERLISHNVALPAPVIVTGCAGFIGARVSQQLLAAGQPVIGLDNLNDAYDQRLKMWRLAQLEHQPGFAFHRLDIGDRQALRDLLTARRRQADQTSACAAVINLAARAGVRPSVENPWVYVESNVTGALNLLDLCREFDIPKFVLASSSSLYGQANPLPYREDQPTDRPLSPYAASKKAAEALCYAYHHLHGLDITVLRYFTAYGPAGRPDMAPFRFVQWISEGRPVTVFGDGQQSRDFTYVDDIARGTVAALRPLGYRVINLGSDAPVILLEVIRLVERLVQRPAQLIFRPAHAADVPATWADISQARQLLAWQPQTTLEEGFAHLVAWYQANRSWASQIVTI
jgi:nucleoside-diphosphate-sugar epimerase